MLLVIAACSLAGEWDGPAPRDTGVQADSVEDSPELIDGGTPRAPEAGELVINEIMDDPDPTADEAGEWIELANVTSDLLVIDGIDVEDDDGEEFALHGVVAPGARWLIAASDDAADNGGLAPDASFDPASFHLENDADEVVLTLDGEELDRVEYDDTFPARKGRSRALDPGHQTADANDDASVWCDGVGAYGTDANEGTPGEANDVCP